MLRVRTVAGPDAAVPGEPVTYRVTGFSVVHPDDAAVSRVSWLIKTPGGAALAHLPRVGPELRVTVPIAWAGATAVVMPYLHSPSAAIAVRTTINRPSAPPPGALLGSRRVRITRQASRYYASVEGEPAFYLGSEVSYGNRRGLMNSNNPPGPLYRPEEYESAHSDWAWYLWPTIICESRGHFTCLNTYDRAAFTFGHIQLGAHTPEDNFAAFFRELLADESASAYFPDLALHDGRICCTTAAGLTQLESATTTSALMAYFNPTPRAVDGAEADRAARIVDWTIRHKFARDLQVAFTVREQRRKLALHAARLPLDGMSDKLCLVVLDVLHQGRGAYKTIAAALRAPDPFDALLSIGASTYHERISTLRAGIRDLEAAGRVGVKVYDRTAQTFVVPSGA